MGIPTVTSATAAACTVNIAGILIDSGFAPGSFIVVAKNEDDWKIKVGADGSVARSQILDNTSTAKLKLLQTAAGNALLSQLRQLDQGSQNGAGVGMFELRDRTTTGQLLVRADHCWIQKPPDAERADEIVEPEWTIYLADAQFNITGNVSL